MSEEDMPPLEDFGDEIKSIQYNKPKNFGNEDYTKPNTRHLEDEEKQKEQIQQVTKKVENINIKIQKEKEKKSGTGFGGFKKGFLGASEPKKTQKITEVKANKKHNPLEIKEVQDSMKMNDYLNETKSEWMTNNFLQKVTNNEKVNKLFTNPEYMKAIDLFKTNPQLAMAKYGSNKEFMEGFQEFCKLMGMQFQSLAKK